MIGTTLQDGSTVTSFGWTGHNHERTRRLPDGSAVDEVSDDKVNWLPWGKDGFTERGREKRDAMGSLVPLVTVNSPIDKMIPDIPLFWPWIMAAGFIGGVSVLLGELGLHHWHWIN